jgi:hypothetical protein
VHVRWEVDDEEGCKPSRIEFSWTSTTNVFIICTGNPNAIMPLTIYHQSEVCILLTQHVQHAMLHRSMKLHSWVKMWSTHYAETLKKCCNVSVYNPKLCFFHISLGQWKKHWVMDGTEFQLPKLQFVPLVSECPNLLSNSLLNRCRECGCWDQVQLSLPPFGSIFTVSLPHNGATAMKRDSVLR